MSTKVPMADVSLPEAGAPQPGREQLLAAFALRYPEVQYALVQFLSEHLTDCARQFDGDLDQMMILAVIGQSHLAEFMARPEARGSRPEYRLSALRIADITGLPRESVRRKLARLAERGWLRREPDGWSLEGPDATDTVPRRDLDGLNQRGLERLARLHLAIARLVARPPSP